jgi:tRNA(adenine34) deaminase
MDANLIDEQFMRVAIKEAEIAAREGNWAMGCVIVINGKIVGRGHNEGYTQKNRLIHAETQALAQAKDELEIHRHEAILYTTYDPCPMCLGAMLVMKIKRLVTGVDLDNSGATGILDHLPPFYQQEKFHIEVTYGVLAKECTQVYFKGKPSQKHAVQYNLK